MSLILVKQSFKMIGISISFQKVIYKKDLLHAAVENGNFDIINILLSNEKLDINIYYIFFLHLIYEISFLNI